MNVKAVIPLVLAVVLGLLAAFMVRNAISRRSASTSTSNLVTVAIAKEDAQLGKQLTKDDVATAKVPAELAPGHVFSDPNQLIGRVLTSPLVKGQTILETLLAPAGAGEGLQSVIPLGMRAVTLEVNEYSGVAGMLAPGCRVDLISVLRDDKSNQSVARTILQNIKVTAIGRNLTATHPEPGQPLPPPSNSVTLLCTPKQAQTLELASQSSRPWLVLRSGQDPAQVSLDGTTYAELRGESSAAPEDVLANADNGAAPTIPAMFPTDIATTKPAEADGYIHRKVTFIRNGVSSDVTLSIPAPRAATTVEVDPEENVVPQR